MELMKDNKHTPGTPLRCLECDQTLLKNTKQGCPICCLECLDLTTDSGCAGCRQVVICPDCEEWQRAFVSELVPRIGVYAFNILCLFLC